MAYTQKTWEKDDLIEASDLNNIEQGIKDNENDIATLEDRATSDENDVAELENKVDSTTETINNDISDLDKKVDDNVSIIDEKFSAIDEAIESLYYKPGDTITVRFRGAGYVTSSMTNVIFQIPLPKPTTATGVTTENSLNMELRENNQYTHGSASGTPANVSSATYTLRENCIDVVAVMGSTTNCTNNSPIGVAMTSDMTFTFIKDEEE